MTKKKDRAPYPELTNILLTVTYQGTRAYVVKARDRADALRRLADRKLGNRPVVFDAVVRDELAVTADEYTPELKSRVQMVSSKGW